MKPTDPKYPELIACDAVPERDLLILNPQYGPDGSLDIDATAKASVTIWNIGNLRGSASDKGGSA